MTTYSEKTEVVGVSNQNAAKDDLYDNEQILFDDDEEKQEMQESEKEKEQTEDTDYIEILENNQAPTMTMTPIEISPDTYLEPPGITIDYKLKQVWQKEKYIKELQDLLLHCLLPEDENDLIALEKDCWQCWMVEFKNMLAGYYKEHSFTMQKLINTRNGFVRLVNHPAFDTLSSLSYGDWCDMFAVKSEDLLETPSTTSKDLPPYLQSPYIFIFIYLYLFFLLVFVFFFTCIFF